MNERESKGLEENMSVFPVGFTYDESGDEKALLKIFRDLDGLF